MRLSTEEALEIINKNKSTKDESKVEETPSVEAKEETSKSVDTNAGVTEDKVEPNDKAVETTTNKDEGSDEPKSDKVDVSNDKPKSEYSPEEKRNFAFMKLQKKNKALKEKYDRDVGAKDSRIKELESILDKYKDLTSDNFRKDDGSVNNDAYVDWKFKQKDMQREVDYLKEAINQDKLQYDVERDKLITERYFQDKELEDYNNLIASKGRDFASSINSVDTEGAFFKYLDTVQEYPIVLRELMSNPNPYLNRIFRSSDPNSIKRKAAIVVDEILDKYYESKSKAPEINNKPAIPVIGKQITNNVMNVEPNVKDRNYWVKYSKEHPRGR